MQNADTAILDSDIPVLDIDPYAEEVMRDPEPFHHQLREAGPVVFLSKYGVYAVGRYDVTHKVLHDHVHFLSSGGIGLTDIRKPGALRAPSPISEVDPPQHTQVRAALTKVISPVVLRQWKTSFTEEAGRVVDRCLEKGQVDAVTETVQEFVLNAFTGALGVKMPKANFLDLGEMNFNQMGPDNEIYRRSMERVAPILDDYQRAFQRESVIPGGFAEKIFEAEDRGEFAPGTGGVQVRSFLRAGVDTTIAGIGETLKHLAQNPAEWEKLKANPGKVKAAFDEAIRLGSPARVIYRVTSGEVDLEGCRLRDDMKVGCFLGAANRDPQKFPDPDRFSVDRETAGVHVALGTGVHNCIGQNIARLEAECILGELVRRVDRIELTGEPVYRMVNALRTLESLPVRLVAKAA
ncbi:cytochrome P450 [Ruixingdingia sedimenti]|uniref:Cytochrome P450 n=1 Tax=Ruixingdingia sedimenti TaxID=3073604 RepID=A0ABU1F2E0_9RHOB|nr:cytochrome P450 [Xinfangfangia sp. LG-4]MDR5651031.1 cytochrome P450 [Xinfangfangia sp. LG-4]